MNKKRVIGAALAGALLFVPYIAESSAVLADGFYVNQTNAERADITNWVANSSEQISTNIQSQHINVNDLNGSRYVIQWGDTLSGISQATGIPIRKLAYDNHIRNIDLIYAGDILILNRNGSYVPNDWSYEGHGTHVANTKVTINNFIDNSDNSVTIVNSPITVNETTNNSSTTNNNSEKTTTTIDNKDYESPVNPVATTTAGSGSSTTGSDAAAEKDADNINATTDSQTTTTDSNANSTSTSSSSKSGLEDSDFADKVSSKLADQLGIDASKVNVDLGDSSSSDASADSESSDADAEETDSNSQTVYDDDQSISMASDKLSATNAAEVAKKIYKQLESDDKLSDVTDADSIDVTLSTTDGGYDFNISLSSSSNDSDSDNSSESDITSDTTSSSVTTSSDDTTDAEDY